MPPTPSANFRPRTALGREYAMRVTKILEGVERLEDAALGQLAAELDRLRADLLAIATRQRTSVQIGGSAQAATLDVQEIIQAITRLMGDFQARAIALVLAAQTGALDAGALLIDGAFKPALEDQARARAEKAKAEPKGKPTAPPTAPTAPPAPSARAPERPDLAPGPGATGSPFAVGRSPAPGAGAGDGGAGGGRLPPITITPGGEGGPSFGSADLPKVRVEGVFPVVSDGLRRATAELAAGEMTSLTTKMRQDMLNGVRRAALGGLSPLEVMRAVDQVLPAAKRGARLTDGVGSSAERIVRTQVSRAMNRSAISRAKDLAESLSKVPGGPGAAARVALVRKQWIATIDGRTRPSHLAAHGQTVGLDEDFVVDGERLEHPGDPSASAGNVINCRCRVVTVLPENPEDLFAPPS